MLIKSKVCITILAIYEMIAVSVLHFQRVCDSIFMPQFCDSWYRYFLFCIIVPLVVLLIVMWIREIVRAHRRRAFIRRAKNTVRGVMSGIRGKISDSINISDLEGIITAAVLVGIKKYADRHPNLRHNVNNIMDIASGEAEIDILSTADEAKPVRRKASASSARRAANRKKK